MTVRNTAIHHAAIVIFANSVEEAEGITMRRLRKSHPSQDGWGMYDVCGIQTSLELLAEELKKKDASL